MTPDDRGRYAWWHSVAWIMGEKHPALGQLDYEMSGDHRGSTRVRGVLWK